MKSFKTDKTIKRSVGNFHFAFLFFILPYVQSDLSVPDTTCLCFTGLLQAQNLLTQLPQQSQANLLQSQPSITLTSQVSFLPLRVAFSYPDVLRDSWTLLNYKNTAKPRNTLIKIIQMVFTNRSKIPNRIDQLDKATKLM